MQNTVLDGLYGKTEQTRLQLSSIGRLSEMHLTQITTKYINGRFIVKIPFWVL